MNLISLANLYYLKITPWLFVLFLVMWNLSLLMKQSQTRQDVFVSFKLRLAADFVW